MIFALVMVACIDDIFGPETPTARFTLRGVVQRTSPAFPVEGAKVFRKGGAVYPRRTPARTRPLQGQGGPMEPY